MSAPQVSRIDFTEVAGLFVVGYSDRADLRLAMEDQLVADLSVHGMVGYPSHSDIPDIVGATPGRVIAAAQRRRAAGVLVVNPVVPEGGERMVRNPSRISPEHPDLQALFADVRRRSLGTAGVAHEAIVEVNLFLLQDDAATLFWSGAALTRAADGSGSGLRDLSEQIADALERAQRQLRGN